MWLGLTESQERQQPNVGVYGITRNRRERRGLELLCIYCCVYGLHYAMYQDTTIPVPGQPSGWQRLLDGITRGLFGVVVIWQDAPELKAYCERHGVRLEVVDPFAYFQSLRARKVDIRRIRR